MTANRDDLSSLINQLLQDQGMSNQVLYFIPKSIPSRTYLVYIVVWDSLVYMCRQPQIISGIMIDYLVYFKLLNLLIVLCNRTFSRGPVANVAEML